MELKDAADLVITEMSSRLSADLRSYQEWDADKLKSIIQEVGGRHVSRLIDEFLGSGPLARHLEDNSVTEILVNGPEIIWVEKQGRLTKVNDKFLSTVTYASFFSRLCQDVGSETTLDSPCMDGHWRGFRVHIISPPLAPHLALSLRKHASSPWTLEGLKSIGWSDESGIRILRNIVQQKKNILFVGATGSGKTSVLNACLQLLPDNERVSILEDTKELSLPNHASIQLTTRKDAKGILREVTLQDLVRHSLRMRPDRIVMGEVRGGEAKDLLMALATGHEGSMGTLHASSAHEALIRLEMLVQLGAPQWSLQAIRKLIYLSLNFIVVVKKKSNGERILDSIHRISSVEDFGLLTEQIDTQAAFRTLDRIAPI